MATDVTANGRSILHKKHGMTHVCAVPDVCKTPTPGGPVPIPYINCAMDSQLADGAKTVKIENSPVAKVTSKISTSFGDEPGTVGGLISSKFKGAMTWKMGSLDVKAEGKSVVRFLDAALHNGNSFNSAFIDVGLGRTAIAYADDFSGLCPICNNGPRQHRVHETQNSAALCRAIIADLEQRFNGLPSNNQRRRSATQIRVGDGRGWRGYMIGVMICDTCGRSFAAQSGQQEKDGFRDIAGQHVDEVLPVAPVSADDLAAANTSNAADFATKRQEIGDAWAEIDDLIAADEQGYNLPGWCAGAKLMATQGHKPGAMTEMFFLGLHWDATYQWRTTVRTPAQLAGYSRSWRNRILQNRAAQVQDTQFGGGVTVASCHTCQALLYMTMCPERACAG